MEYIRVYVMLEVFLLYWWARIDNSTVAYDFIYGYYS